jgi:Uncharacterized protein conserved in bacteria
MKYFVIEGTFKNPVPVEKKELEIAIADHLAYLQKGLDGGWILFSGPKEGTGGGIIICKMSSYEEVEEYIAKDPLKVSGVQDYRIVEFKKYKCQTPVSEWFE